MSSKRREQLLSALNAAFREVSGLGVLHSQEIAARLGINSTDLECLDHVATRGPLTAGALAEITGLTTGAITGVIDRLERAGFVRREHDADDRRKVLVRLVPDSLARVMPLFAPMEKRAMAALAGYSDKELDFLLRFLESNAKAARDAMTELRTMPAVKKAAKKRAVRKT
jgi:DNA-binding MarR family transcriptional regulator